MKIDLHCHTMKTKSTENESRNVTLKLFKEKVELANIKILAITNHNKFDIDNYNTFSLSVSEHCIVWPGVELDVEGFSGKTGHIIIVANPNIKEKFYTKTEELIDGYTADNFIKPIQDVYNHYKDLDIIIIPHCYKDKALPLSDINELEEIMHEEFRLFRETTSLTSLTVLQANKYKAILGSDVIDWANYENEKVGELKFPISSFENFIKLLKKDINFIADLIEEEFSEKIKVYGKSEEKENEFEISIYRDINIIFGEKGSGKTEILKSLQNYYKIEKGEDPVFFSGGDKDSWIKKIIKNEEEDFTLNNLNNPSDCENEIAVIKQFQDVIPISLTLYKNYFTNCKKNKNKERMKCLWIGKGHLQDVAKLESIYNEYKGWIDTKKEILEYDSINLIEIQEKEIFITILQKLIDKSYQESVNEWINQSKEYLFDDFIEKMATYVAENIGNSPMPTETGFAQFAKNRINLKKSTDNILLITSDNFNEISDPIGNLGKKGKVYLSKKFCFINKNNKETIDSKSLYSSGIKTKLKEIITNIENINANYFSSEIVSVIENCKTLLSEIDIDSILKFMAVEKTITINGVKYTPSKGETAILALQYELLSKEDKQIFLIDEPELSLGSNYINSTIVPLFKRLAKSQKIIVVSSHDPNIAIRTRPVNSILKITDNNVYKTYSGNMFSNLLENIDDNNDVLNWKEQSLFYLEGGEEAFSERGELYEQ